MLNEIIDIMDGHQEGMGLTIFALSPLVLPEEVPLVP
jgi:hypothetical protein